MKKFLLVLLAVVLSISLMACGNGDDVVENEDLVNDEQSDDNVDSIVSLAPAITEVLVEMGYGDKLVAADGPESQSRQGVPEDIVFMDMMAPDVEQLIALQPDIVFASEITIGGGEDPLKILEDEGISVHYIYSSNSIEEIYENILFIGQVLNDEEGSQDIVDNMKNQIEEIRERNENEERKTAYFEIAAAPDMYSSGSGTFLNEMLEILGLENILADNESWMNVSEEIILDRNPDTIFTNVAYIENSVEEILSRDGWESISAVSNGDVYYINNSHSSLPNHNIVKAILEMEEAVR